MSDASFLLEIHGHDEARRHLHEMLRRARVPNGILITGEEGIGKRTLALAFAKALLAGDREGRVDPSSPKAKKFEARNHADLELVEREENQRQIGIERIRELKESFSLKPVESDRRVGILVDAERLTDEAGNSLLKLLEEPPEGSHLILTARDRGAVLSTLLSRCQWVPLRPVPAAQVEAFLAARGVDPARLPLIAAVAEGRPGFAARLAEEDFESNQLAQAIVLAAGTAEPFAYAESLAAGLKDAGKVLEVARERLRPILRMALFVLRAAWKAAEGSERGAAVVALLPGESQSALGSLGAVAAERRIASVMEALADLDRNLGLELVLERLLVSAA